MRLSIKISDDLFKGRDVVIRISLKMVDPDLKTNPFRIHNTAFNSTLIISHYHDIILPGNLLPGIHDYFLEF